MAVEKKLYIFNAEQIHDIFYSVKLNILSVNANVDWLSEVQS